jgi:hypothetical protein
MEATLARNNESHGDRPKRKIPKPAPQTQLDAKALCEKAGLSEWRTLVGA